MEKTTKARDFEMTNGLGTISFSPELITSIIQKVLSSYKGYEYKTHTIIPIRNDYYEVSIHIKSANKDVDFRTIDRLQKDLLLVMKQSLSLTCVVILNIDNGK